MSWVDTHCHLDFGDTDAAATVEAARAEGVEWMITIGTDLDTSSRAVEIARCFDGVSATVGVHPTDSAGYRADDEAALAGLAQAHEVVGIGETGFDHYHEGVSLDDQESSFRSQINLAKRLDLALVVHTRDAHADTKRVLRDEGPPDRFVMHCFSGDEHDAAEYLDLGAVLSFSGTVTFRNARAVQRAAQACPLERMLLETDSPFLSPHPFRGQPNSPARIPVIGRFVAGLKGIDPAKLAETVEATARATFSTGRPGGAD